MILRDGQGTPFNALDTYEIEVCSPGAFTGGSANTRGDHDGTNDPTTLFNVTGDVAVRLYAVCTTTLVGAATIEVGLTGNTALLLAQVADATNIAAQDIWIDNSPAEVRGVALSSVPGPFLIVNGQDIIETIGTANITAGALYYVCMWRPITPGSSVKSAF